MIDSNTLDEMDLPLANHKEELETISEDRLRPLFDVTLFQFCSQDKRDKGIDLIYELKKSGKHTGYRFLIQLKATESIQPNKTDGSFSLQLDTSNINYLLNQSPPSYYIFYTANTNTFYYESVIEVVKFLQQKDADWSKQKTHSYRFSKPLLPTKPIEIYREALRQGILHRNLKESSMLIAASAHPTDRISLDSNLNMTDDASIRNIVEVLGFVLINEGKWGEILVMHQKATGEVASTALYNLILGISNYYAANRWDAISFLKKARGRKAELDEEMQNILDYFDATVKYAIGLMSYTDYGNLMHQLEETDSVGLYIKMEKAKENYLQSLRSPSGEQYDQLVKDMNAIINHSGGNKSIQMTAKCEMILFEGFENNTDYVSGVAKLKAYEAMMGPDVKARSQAFQHFISVNTAWNENVQAIKKEAKEAKNDFAYYMAITNEAKVSYQLDVNTSMIAIDIDRTGQPKMDGPDKTDLHNYLISLLGQAGKYFYQIGHVENLIAAYFTLYELFHYTKQTEKAIKMMELLEEVADKYDLEAHKEKLLILKNGGTTHERFSKWISDIVQQGEKEKTEYDKLLTEMMAMDEAERKLTDKRKKGMLHIHLFPIDYFMFPTEKKEKVFEILQINEQARQTFNMMFKKMIPVANTFYNPIEKEGFQDGHNAHHSLINWQNIYRVRKAFYENKFYRDENIP